MALWIVDADERNIWSHSQHMRDLYRSRAQDEATEMDCAAQAIDLLAPYLSDGDSVLDVGAGTGWLFHSFRRRKVNVDYWAIDMTEPFVQIGRDELSLYGLESSHFIHGLVEDLRGQVDHVICLNVLSNMPNWHLPLERMSQIASKTIILRESISDYASTMLVRDRFLDPPSELMVHVNTYSRTEVVAFLGDRGFSVRMEEDKRTKGVPEMVIGYPHHWTFLVAEKLQA